MLKGKHRTISLSESQYLRLDKIVQKACGCSLLEWLGPEPLAKKSTGSAAVAENAGAETLNTLRIKHIDYGNVVEIEKDMKTMRLTRREIMYIVEELNYGKQEEGLEETSSQAR